MLNLERIRNPHCKDCELFLNARTVCLMGSGSPVAKLMLVGEAPGEHEDDAGLPFVGEAGKLLNGILKEFDINRKTIYISNAVKCRPPANRTPHLEEMKACRHYLLEEIQEIKPTLIIGLGVAAMKTLLKSKDFKLGGSRGAIYHLPEDHSISIMCTYHPAAVRRNPNWLPAIVEDFDRALTYLNEGFPEVSKGTYKRGFAPVTEGRIVIDVETRSLKDLTVLCVGSSTKSHRGYCITELDREAKEVLADPKITKIGHNFKFDYKALRFSGVEVNGPWDDTLIQAHILDENRLSLGLKELALTYTDMGRYAEKVESLLRLSKGNMESIPKGARELYCAKDCDATFRLDSVFYPQIVKEGLLPIYSLTMRGAKIMGKAEVAGVKIDDDRRTYLSEAYRKKMKSSLSKIRDIVGDKKFNPHSPTQLGRLLVGSMGFPILGKTKHNKVKVDRAILDRYLAMDKTGLVQSIISFRESQKMYAMYLDPERPVAWADGLIHCDYRIAGPDTGRYSCSNPNLQQVKKKGNSPIKSMFVSKFEGGSIVQFDCDQGELRMLAQYTMDPILLKTFREGVDVHAITASSIFRCNVEDVTTEQRATGKLANFAILYGVGNKKLGKNIGVSEEKAAAYISRYFNRHKKVREWIDARHEQILKEGEVSNLFGRKRRILVTEGTDYWKILAAQRQAANAPIQSALHDLNVLGMVALDGWLRSENMRSHIIMEVHDAIILDCPKEEVKTVIRKGKKILDNPDTGMFKFEFKIPITYSVSSGRTWKEASD